MSPNRQAFTIVLAVFLLILGAFGLLKNFRTIIDAAQDAASFVDAVRKMAEAAPFWAVALVTVGLANALMLLVGPWMRQQIEQKRGAIGTATFEPVSPPTRDVSIGEAIAYLAFGSWGRTFTEAASSHDVNGEWEYKQFQQAAADGDIPVWGRTGKSRVFEIIPKEFWRQNHFDWFNLLRGDSGTEPIAKRDYNEVRYSETMTSKAATELLFKKQPPELLRAKSSARQLAKLLDEGVTERNKLLSVLSDFDASHSEKILVAWDERVLSVFTAGGVAESSRSKFKTLDTWYGHLNGEAGRGPEQERIEMIWNKKLQILRAIIDEVSS
jgi:hypothetical protein